MTLATRPFGNLFSYSRNSTKWEMGPDKKFIEFPTGIPAYRYDYESGKRLGLSYHQEVTTLNTDSIILPSEIYTNVTDVPSLFEGKAAKKIENIHESSPSVGATTNGFALPAAGATIDVIFETVDPEAKVAFGYRDTTANGWDILYTFQPSTESFTAIQGSSVGEVALTAAVITASGPNGGIVFRLRFSKDEQVTPGNNLSAYFYPGYESGSFAGFRGSILHYIGVYDVPFLTPPIWAEGAAGTRARDFVFIDPLMDAVQEHPCTIFAEIEIDSEETVSQDNRTGVFSRIESGGGISNRAWMRVDGSTATDPIFHVVSGSESPATAFPGISIPNGESIKSALSWDAQKFGATVNGVSSQDVDSVAGVPTTARKRLTIGHRLSSDRLMNGVIKRLRVVNEYWDTERREQETAA